MVDIGKELAKLEGHDVIVLLGVGLLILITVKLTSTLTVFEARSFLRESLINIAILLLVADLVIHVGRLEEKVLAEEERILKEEKKILREEAVLKKMAEEAVLKKRAVKKKKIRKKK